MKPSDRACIFLMIYCAAWMVEADADWLKFLSLSILTLTGMFFMTNYNHKE